MNIKVAPDYSGEKNVTIPVRITYADGSVNTSNVKFTVADEATSYDISYPHAGDIKQGESATVEAIIKVGDQVVTPLGVPTWSIVNGSLPEGVSAEINAGTGDVTIRVGEDVAVGTQIEVPVTVTFEDGSVGNSVAAGTVVRKDSQEEILDVRYEDTTVKQGDTVSVAPAVTTKNGEQSEFPIDATVETLANEESTLTFTTDPGTGFINVTAAEDAATGTYEVPVTVKFSDNSVEATSLTVTVTEKVDENNDTNDDEKGTESNGGSSSWLGWLGIVFGTLAGIASIGGLITFIMGLFR